MANIIPFHPKHELEVSKNLAGFIKHCRYKIFVFGEGLDFNSNKWDITETVNRKGIGKKRERITFNTLSAAKFKRQEWMSSPYISFAKAYMRYMHGFHPTKSYGHRLTALRTAECALKESGEHPDPTQINANILNRAVQIAIEHGYSTKVIYRIGGQLEQLASFMNENRLLVVPTFWRNPSKKPSDSIRVGAEFDARRAEKMPSLAALKAVADIFYHSQSPADVLVSSAVGILLAAPSRISELLSLPGDCELHQKLKDGTPVYGLRWWPAKGSPPMIKYIPSKMAEVAKIAVQKIRSMTEPARRIAAWYEKNPTRLYLPEEFEYLRKAKYVTSGEIEKLFSLRDFTAAKDWCVAREIKMYPGEDGWQILFANLERVIISMLPKNFPICDDDAELKYSHALMVVRLNELHDVRATNPCMFEPISTNTVNYGLGARVRHGGASIFTRNDYIEEDGSPLKITSHQLRHLLNTIALSGNMNPLLLAMWSGRKDVKQTAAYDHEPQEQILQKMRDAVGDSFMMHGPLSDPPKNLPVSRDEFSTLVIPTLHTTDIGYCKHDYALSPCELHLDCIHCEDLVCLKGNFQKQARIRQCLDEALALLRLVEEDGDSGVDGWDIWREHQNSTVERLQELWELMENSAVPIGAFIQLRQPEHMKNLPGVKKPIQASSRRAIVAQHP